MGDSGRSHGGLKFLESIDCNDEFGIECLWGKLRYCCVEQPIN